MKMPELEHLLVLPRTSEPRIDELLEDMEEAYAAMDVDRWIAFFTDDFEQIDVARRVHVMGREAWRAQTGRINGFHREMRRAHHGRALLGDWIVVEVEWTGIVRGEALGKSDRDKEYRYCGLALLQLAEGRIRRQIIYGDTTTLNEQLDLE
jgi:hypothetical protein